MSASLIRQSLYDRNGSPAGSRFYHCIYCGDNAQCWDHVVPKKKGGSDDADNLVPCCIACNSAKGNRPLDVFLKGYPVVMERVSLFIKGLYPAHAIGVGDNERVEHCFITRKGEKDWRSICRPHPRHEHFRYHWVEDKDGGASIMHWGGEVLGWHHTNGGDWIDTNDATISGYRYLRPVRDEGCP